MVLITKWPFFYLDFLGNIAQENVFFDILERKETPFWAIKTRSWKSWKIDLFPKGLTHGFDQKMAIFLSWFFRQYRPGECVFRYSRTKRNAFLGYKNKKLKKSGNWDFSKGVSPWFWSKNGHFLNVFLGNKGKENVFYDILE